jgi:hypothetical protein
MPDPVTIVLTVAFSGGSFAFTLYKDWRDKPAKVDHISVAQNSLNASLELQTQLAGKLEPQLANQFWQDYLK